MSEKINWSFSAQVLKGPVISGGGNLDVKGYEKIDLKLVKDVGTDSASITNFSSVSLLIISSDTYDPLITYAGNHELAIATCKLDGPHIFIGQMAADFLKKNNTITFTNGSPNDIEIQILIGRKTV